MKDIGTRLPNLEVRDLCVVLALAEAGTTARAATLLHLTQPAVSRALLSIEDRLGVALFDRSSRGLTPTEAGRRLLQGAPGVLAELGDLEHRVRAKSVAPARLRVVCECYTAYRWLPSALAKLRADLPDFDVSIAIECTNDPIAGLLSGAIDAALITTAEVPPGALEQRKLFSDEIVFLVASQHPLAARKRLTRDDLRTHTILTSNAPPTEHEWFMTRVFGRKRPRLRFQRLPLTEAILDMARAGMGIAVMSEWMAGPHLERGELVAKRLSSGPLARPWRLAYRAEAADAALRLLTALRGAPPLTCLPE
jgi:LysR family transcriptional regulator, regulator for metE and metH